MITKDIIEQSLQLGRPRQLADNGWMDNLALSFNVDETFLKDLYFVEYVTRLEFGQKVCVAKDAPLALVKEQIAYSINRELYGNTQDLLAKLIFEIKCGRITRDETVAKLENLLKALL